MNVRIFGVAAVAAVVSAPAAAQFSSDIPGVPRGLVSMRGGRQSRTEWVLTGYHLPSQLDSTKSVNAGGVQLGFGSSYRVRGKFELGFDFVQRYPDLVRAVTAEQVREAAERHLHPDRLAVISAGAS